MVSHLPRDLLLLPCNCRCCLLYVVSYQLRGSELAKNFSLLLFLRAERKTKEVRFCNNRGNQFVHALQRAINVDFVGAFSSAITSSKCNFILCERAWQTPNRQIVFSLSFSSFRFSFKFHYGCSGTLHLSQVLERKNEVLLEIYENCILSCKKLWDENEKISEEKLFEAGRFEVDGFV